ncbi:MAG: Kelch repeat-containing protein [Planctomycetota bacterium]|jgi:N-acetylneuraminic acid mutarotase
MKDLNDYRMRLVIVGIVAAGVLGGGQIARAELAWTQKADMPTARWMHASAAINGKIYVIGGRLNEGDWWKLSTVEEYDPATDTWTRKADMPTGRNSLSTSVVSGKIYAIGGNGGPSAVQEYDPGTDTWARKADMPTPRRALSTCVVNGKIYAIGGMTPGIFLGLRTVEEYDPVTDTWTRKADMPTGVWGLCACVVSGKIYALGGRPFKVAIPNVQEYDPATDTWTRKADMPVGTSQMASAVIGNKIIVIGGWIHSNNPPYAAVQIYDPETDIWTMEADAPFLRAAFSASVVNNRIYAIGGTDRPHPCPAISTVYVSDIIVDFNGDGIVDVKDVVILTHYWGSSYSLCDIGPTALGDGIVDVRDLLVLAEYIEPEAREPGLIAHWKLDETKGDMAYDSVSGQDAFVIGDPLWQPIGGIVDGALQLDGTDDFISTDFVLNPADGPFSVFTWIRGGAPGKVIISQRDIPNGESVNWLLADPSEGKLMTEFEILGRGARELLSQTVITDGNWHRIGFVWNGSNLTLYVDDVEEAVNTKVTLAYSTAGLHIGAGTTLEPASFFSGLIDDVRIYNRAVTP